MEYLCYVEREMNLAISHKDNLNSPFTQQSGVTLITVLLYLCIVTIYVTGAFNISLLQFKMKDRIKSADIAFQNAESALVKAAFEIEADKTIGKGALDANTTYRFERVSTEKCGIWFYQIYAEARYASAKRSLESVISLPVYNEECPDVEEKKHRILWREVGL